jgi:hypothetical protein
MASTARNGDSFNCLYVDVRTSQETHLWVQTVYYGDKIFLFLLS